MSFNFEVSRINSEVKLLAETMLEEFRGNKSETLIGVHVRRTDYKDLLGENSISYQICVYFYQTQIQRLKKLFKRSKGNEDIFRSW